MIEIMKIIGNSTKTYFKMSNGKMIVANSEFRAKSGNIDGFIVYKEGIKCFDTGILLTPYETIELIKMYDEYKLNHIDIVEWA